MTKTREELDDILNCALDALELDESGERESGKSSRAVSGTKPPRTSYELPSDGHKASLDSSTDGGRSVGIALGSILGLLLHLYLIKRFGEGRDIVHISLLNWMFWGSVL